MPRSPIVPGLLVLHAQRSEMLAETVIAWLQAHPLDPLEQDILLVQSNGMAEWLKMTLAQRAGVCAATRVELPGRFMWRTYRQVLGTDAVSAHIPLDKTGLTWRLMRLLPMLLGEPGFEPIAGFLRPNEPDRLYQLAARLADHVVVLHDGRVQAAGPAEALWTRLDTPLSASDDAAAVLSAEVLRHEPAQGLSLLQVGQGEAAVPLWTGLHMGDGGGQGAAGHRVRVRVLARDVSVSLSRAHDSSILNILPAVVAGLRDDAQGSVMLNLQLGQGRAPGDGAAHLLARITRRSAEHLGLHVGQAVFAQVKGVALLRD